VVVKAMIDDQVAPSGQRQDCRGKHTDPLQRAVRPQECVEPGTNVVLDHARNEQPGQERLLLQESMCSAQIADYLYAPSFGA
jgi:hypothetical protein